MQLIRFDGKKCHEGMDMEAMAKAMGKVAKDNPGATMESVDLVTPVFLHWEESASPGVLEVRTESSFTRKKAKPGKVFTLPGNCVVRLRPTEGPGVSLAITPNGSYRSVSGADSIVEPPLWPAPNATPMVVAAMAWLRNGRRGQSSEVMCKTLTGQSDGLRPEAINHPLDGDDFKRCSLFLAAVPQARAELDKMTPVSPQWAALVPGWDELEALLKKEDWKGLNQKMKELLPDPPRPKRAGL